VNKKENQRYQETKKRIQEVFQELLQNKEIHEVTVAEICRRAGIHRTTFYGHYTDVYELMESMARDMYTDMMNYFVKDSSVHLREGFLHLFSYIKENKEFFSGYMKFSKKQNRPAKLLPTMLKENMDSIIKELGYANEAELLYHQTFFSEGLVAVIELWISGGCLESPEELCHIIEEEYDISKTKMFLS